MPSISPEFEKLLQDIRDNKLTELNLSSLFSVFDLKLNLSHMVDSDLVMLMNAIQSGSALQTLILGSNSVRGGNGVLIKKEGLIALAGAIENNCSLTAFAFENDESVRGHENFYFGLEKICDAIGINTCLKILALSHIGQRTVGNLINSLERNSHLEKLYLNPAYLTEDHLNLLFHALESNKKSSLRVLHVSNEWQSDLSNEEICIQFLKKLENNPTLKEVALPGFHRLSERVLLQLAKTIKNNRVLEKFTFGMDFTFLKLTQTKEVYTAFLDAFNSNLSIKVDFGHGECSALYRSRDTQKKVEVVDAQVFHTSSKFDDSDSSDDDILPGDDAKLDGIADQFKEKLGLKRARDDEADSDDEFQQENKRGKSDNGVPPVSPPSPLRASSLFASSAPAQSLEGTSTQLGRRRREELEVDMDESDSVFKKPRFNYPGSE